jgi:predicted RNA binding protein YcfA (HicA-like mRNA interferase family)
MKLRYPQSVDKALRWWHHVRIVSGMPCKVGEVTRLLERNGWYLRRTRGSHRHFGHAELPGLVTVSGHPSDTLKPKTEASILRQAGLKGDNVVWLPGRY